MIELLIRDRVGYIMLNRVEKKNALNFTFITEFKKALDDFAANDSVKVVVIGSNSDVFCAGADLEYLMSLKNNRLEDNIQDTRHIAELFEKIYQFPKTTISMVEGHAIAGGCGIATATDFCYATSRAKFGYSEVKIGFVPAIVSVYLLKKIGESRAKELLLTGKLVSGEEAKTIGIVSKLSESATIRDDVHAFAIELATTTSSTSIRFTKKLITDLYGLSWEDSLNKAIESNAKMRETDDFKKGLNSFIEKSPLNWS